MLSAQFSMPIQQLSGFIFIVTLTANPAHTCRQRDFQLYLSGTAASLNLGQAYLLLLP